MDKDKIPKTINIKIISEDPAAGKYHTKSRIQSKIVNLIDRRLPNKLTPGQIHLPTSPKALNVRPFRQLQHILLEYT